LKKKRKMKKRKRKEEEAQSSPISIRYGRRAKANKVGFRPFRKRMLPAVQPLVLWNTDWSEENSEVLWSFHYNEYRLVSNSVKNLEIALI
jgi:hypothetical protein